MAPDVVEMLVTGQTAIFDILKELREEVKAIGIQGNEIDHINANMAKIEAVNEDQESRLTDIEKVCIKNHTVMDRREGHEGEPMPENRKRQPEERPLWVECLRAIAITASVLLFGLVAFTLFENIQPYLDFHRTQITKEAK